MNANRLIAFAVLAGALLAGPVHAAAPAPGPSVAQGLHAVLLDITRAGDRLVAVGERGTVLLSDDNGTAWRPAAVPVNNTLTGVRFVDGRQGWAIGHAGVVLHSDDGGEHWALQLNGTEAAKLELDAAQVAGDEARLSAAKRLVADGADKPWLALSFSDARHGLVVGAYGLAMATDDGGATWQSWMGRLPNPQGLHLYAVQREGAAVYIAGEQGLFLRSADAGARFDALPTPYEGSLFALAPLPDQRVLLGGLRGSLLAFDPRTDQFDTLANPVPVSVNALVPRRAGTLVINQAGGLLQLNGLGPALPLGNQPGPPLIAATEARDGSLVAVGFAGPARIALPSANLPATE